jgi:hypothetical protein
MNFTTFNRALGSTSASVAENRLMSISKNQGRISTYRERQDPPNDLLKARTQEIEKFEVPRSIDEFFQRVNESLADLYAIARSFPEIVSAEDRMWLDNIGDANRLLRGEFSSSGSGGRSTGGSSGGGDDDNGGKPNGKSDSSDSMIAVARSSTQARGHRDKRWHERMAESLKLLFSKIGGRLWTAAKSAVKEFANGAMGKSAEIASAWGKFWNIAGRVTVGVLIGFLGGGGGGA